MNSYWFRNELNLHWYLFGLTFVVIALWELWKPRKAHVPDTPNRWSTNISLMVIGNVVAIFALPFSAVLTASHVQGSPIGLLNRASLPFIVSAVLTFLVLDLFRYFQHRLYHAIGPLWRLHRVHHSDPDYDLTTSLRFHPGEAILTQGTYLLAVALLAPPPMAVLAGEMILVMQTFFGHANVIIPSRVDALLRLILITPDMHRIHHSDEMAEQHANLGGVLSCWDRVFGTYLAEPAAGLDQMQIGLRGYRRSDSFGIVAMLSLPFRKLSGIESVDDGVLTPTSQADQSLAGTSARQES